MSEEQPSDYNDSYPTCAETYSTLRIFSDDLDPDQITELLQVEATRGFHKGESYSQGRLLRKTNGWFFSTEGLCDSKDTRRHIDHILSLVEKQGESVQKIRSQGCKIDLMSYWVSGSGQGGPCLDPEQMLKLGRLGIPVWWDIYFADE